MKIVKLAEFKQDIKFKQVMNRSKQNYDALFVVVQKIMADVKENGDKAVREYTKKFDQVDVVNTEVSSEEIKDAYKKVSRKFLAAVEQSIYNITLVHQDQIAMNAEKVVEPAVGIRVWKKWRPIEKVGLYVPGGRALYPSSVLMNAIPAKVAGCQRIVITTPPRKDGSVAPELLVAADKLGITEIYKIGGVQAIAALAYGTQTVPKVYKIVGPGNAYVTTAKLAGFMSGEISIDSPAGPSEVFIIADETANPRFIAADLMADVEHGPDGAAVLITTSETLAKEVLLGIEQNVTQFATRENIKSSIENLINRTTRCSIKIEPKFNVPAWTKSWNLPSVCAPPCWLRVWRRAPACCLIYSTRTIGGTR